MRLYHLFVPSNNKIRATLYTIIDLCAIFGLSYLFAQIATFFIIGHILNICQKLHVNLI